MDHDDARDPRNKTDLDPGAFIGHEPERAAETIPGGVTDEDERISAYDSRSGVPGEPDTDDHIGDPLPQADDPEDRQAP